MEKACNNCGTLVSSPYCPHCGQKASVGRLNMHALLHEWWHGFTHVDKGVLLLIKELAFRPRKVYLSYFSGARKTYFSPVVFFLVTFGLFIFLDQKVFDYEDYIYRAFNSSGHYNEYGRLYHLELKYIALALLPFQALLSWLFFFRQRNLAECITFWLYCIGFINVVLIIATPLRLWLIDDKKIVDNILHMIALLIMLFHLWRVFGTSVGNVIWVFVLLFVLQVIDVYVNYYFIIHSGIPASYPALGDAIRLIVLPS